MSPPNFLYSTILFTAGFTCLLLSGVIRYFRSEAAGAKPLAFFLLGLAWWDITYAVFWADLPGPRPYFWLDITLAGAFVAPTAFLVFALEFSNTRHLLNRRFILALLIEPILAFVLLWTDPLHNLYFGGKRALNTMRIVDAGPIHWANIYYSYLLILVAFLILFGVARRSKGVYRSQATIILVAAVAPWIANTGVAFFGGGALPDADLTPFVFSITALAIAFALIRHRLLDIVPVARGALIENMSEGVLVLDLNNRIVDVNPAARKELTPGFLLGDRAETSFSRLPDLVERFSDVAHARTEIIVEDAVLDLSISTLRDAKNRPMGRLVVWRDITEIKQAQKKLERLAITDELTLTHNRRHFMELAEKQISHARRRELPLTLAMIDLDYFKEINDRHGHPAGDKALAALAATLRWNVRDFDIVGRLGGEEFAVLMPETDGQSASQAAERLRAVVADAPIDLGTETVYVTLSLGLTEFADEEDTLSSMLYRADQALYRAKNTGRNRVVLWNEGAGEKVSP